MILIRCKRPDLISKYFDLAGIRPGQVLFNAPATTPGVRVIVTVGGEGCQYLHCFVQQHAEVPIIACLDPMSPYCFQDVRKRTFVVLALAKARMLDNGEAQPVRLPAEAIRIATSRADLELVPHGADQTLAIDIECNPDTGELTCIGVAWQSQLGPLAVVVPFARGQLSYWTPEDEAAIWLHLAAILLSPARKCFQNFLFDTTTLSRLGVPIRGPIVDTMIAAHLIQPELDKNLADLARINLFVEPWKGLSSYESTPELWHYNGLDAIYTLLILQQQETFLQDKLQGRLWRDVYHALPEVLLRITEHGMAIDKAALAEMTAAVTAKRAELAKQLTAIAQPLLPIEEKWKLWKGSVQKAQFLTLRSGSRDRWQPPESVKMCGKLGYPVYNLVSKARVYKPTSHVHNKLILKALGIKGRRYAGKESLDDLVLQKLWDKHRHPFIAALRDFRTWDKLLTTYCNVTLDDDGRLRFLLKPTGTVGARFSSSATSWGTGFNIQNLPKEFRKIIVPSKPGWVILNMDFKQADPHVVGWLAGETKMIDLMDQGGDLHAYTGSAIAGRDITKDPGYIKETSLERKFGKAANNALNYAAGPARFQDMIKADLGLTIDAAEAKRIIDAYFSLWKGIKSWHAETEAQIAQTRRLVTPFGRVREFLGPLNDRLIKEALNYVPQSTVADALNMVWLRALENGRRQALHWSSLAQVHDSLVFECRQDDVAQAIEVLQEAVQAVTFEIKGQTCRFTADFSVGPSWGDQRGV